MKNPYVRVCAAGEPPHPEEARSAVSKDEASDTFALMLRDAARVRAAPQHEGERIRVVLAGGGPCFSPVIYRESGGWTAPHASCAAFPRNRQACRNDRLIVFSLIRTMI
jgi:hypothetical protein